MNIDNLTQTWSKTGPKFFLLFATVENNMDTYIPTQVCKVNKFSSLRRMDVFNKKFFRLECQIKDKFTTMYCKF